MNIAPQRVARWIQGVSIALILAGLLLLLAQLPIRPMLDPLQEIFGGMGWRGMVAYGAVYVVVTLLAIPPSAFTAGAGLIFGLGWGIVVGSAASTVAAAAAFLIARYAARGWIQHRVEESRRLAAVEDAIRTGGWRIVALLRLSPVVPSNLQNYLYGLTPIHFWPCVLTTWLCSLPGTFVFAYLGYLARIGVQAAEDGALLTAWAFRAVGFAATVGVALYVGHLARNALRKQAAIEPEEDDIPDRAAPAQPFQHWATFGLPAAAILVLSLAVASLLHPSLVRNAVLDWIPWTQPSSTPNPEIRP